MKNKIEEIAKKTISDLKEKKINRKEAIKKTGYIAVTVATTMILLGTPKYAAASPEAPPGW